MRIVLILFLCCTVPIYGQQNFPTKPPATDESYLFGLEQEYFTDLKCLARMDAIFKSKWTTDLEKISIEGLDIVEPKWEYRQPSKPIYNTVEEEWVMESGSAGKKVESCLRGLIPEIVPLMNRAEISCVNSIFAKHIEEEVVHEEVFKRSLKSKARDQLPFRKFISFGELVEMMFQSRTPDALNDVERGLYEHAETFLTTEQDKINPTFTIEQSCTWKNSVALRKAPNVEARLNEFVRQVKDTYNQLLANQVVKGWYGNITLPRDKYLAWLRARGNMTLQIREEVDRLRNQKKDTQWLCERATELARRLYREQMDILPERNTLHGIYVDIESEGVAQKTRNIAKAMEKAKDFRQPLLKILAEKFEEATKCLSAFVHLVQNHRRFDVALAFVDSDYTYSEFYCKNPDEFESLIATFICKCVGSFCVTHSLSTLFAEEYVLMEGPEGIYRVVTTGATAKKIAASLARNHDLTIAHAAKEKTSYNK